MKISLLIEISLKPLQNVKVPIVSASRTVDDFSCYPQIAESVSIKALLNCQGEEKKPGNTCFL